VSVEIKIVYNNFPHIRKAAQPGTRAIVLKYSRLVHTDIIAQMQQPKHGRVYRSRKGVQKWHRASAPGQAPAIDTESYMRSIGNKWAGRYSRIVYTNDPRGPMFNRGTSKMLPRPHFAPAARKYRRQFNSEMKRFLRRMNK